MRRTYIRNYKWYNENMTLVFSKNNKPDTRMIEYDQAVVRLGLEKAAAHAELDRVRAEASEIGERKAILLNEIAEAEKKLSVIKQEVVDVVNAGKEDIAAMSAAQQETGTATDEKTKKLVQLEEYLVSLQDKVSATQKNFNTIGERVNEARKVFDTVNSELSISRGMKMNVEADIVALQELKSELKESVAALEKAMAYLAEKEQFLNRKEADLIKYEKRVEKMREDAGSKNKMSFK